MVFLHHEFYVATIPLSRALHAAAGPWRRHADPRRRGRGQRGVAVDPDRSVRPGRAEAGAGGSLAVDAGQGPAGDVATTNRTGTEGRAVGYGRVFCRSGSVPRPVRFGPGSADGAAFHKQTWWGRRF